MPVSDGRRLPERGSVRLGGMVIAYALVRGKSRRYTYFRFRPDMTLEIALPQGRRVDLESVISGKSDWILKNYEEMLRSRRILEGERVMFDGEYLTIRVRPAEEGGEAIEVDRGGHEVVVSTNDPSRVKELLRRLFIRETSRYVVGRLSELSRSLLIRYRKVDVREIKNWGYCTRDGRLSFSWQLIALPESLREYVVLHEVAHLSKFDHSRAFKRRLGELCPDYRERETELDRVTPIHLR